MAGVHRLEHVQRFAAADFADHDPVRPHTQGVADQVADGNRTAALDIRRPAFQPDHVLLLQLQLDRVLDGDDAFVVRDERGEDIQQGGLAGAGTTGDDDIQPGLDTGFKQLGHGRGEGVESDQVIHRQRDGGELPDGQRRAVDREGRDDGVDARSVLQPGVNQR